MALVQIIYASTPFEFDELALAAILATARYHNKRDGITGSLICRSDLFLQMLEGGREKVEATYARIARDPRHLDVTLLWSGEASARLFGDWEMRHDPMRSWMWSRDDVGAGAVRKATADELFAVFRRVLAEPHEAEGL